MKPTMVRHGSPPPKSRKKINWKIRFFCSKELPLFASIHAYKVILSILISVCSEGSHSRSGCGLLVWQTWARVNEILNVSWKVSVDFPSIGIFACTVPWIIRILLDLNRIIRLESLIWNQPIRVVFLASFYLPNLFSSRVRINWSTREKVLMSETSLSPPKKLRKTEHNSTTR